MSNPQERKRRYAQKLKDPRWQKKRLQILERDGWSCQECGDTETTLHVHHKRYGDGEPWEVPDAWFETLCEDCHAYESEHIPVALKEICDAIRLRFTADDIRYIAFRLEEAELPPNTASSVVTEFLSSPDLISLAEGRYFERVRRNREQFHGSEGDGGGS